MSFKNFQVSELVLTISFAAVAFGLGTLLLVVLLNMRFARFRHFTCWTLKRWLDPDRFEANTLAHEFVLCARYWLSADVVQDERSQRNNPRSTRVFSNYANSFKLGESIGHSRSYETFLTEDRKAIVKIALDESGARVLAKEGAVLQHLRQKARAGVYLKYLPTPLNTLRNQAHSPVNEPWAYKNTTQGWACAAKLLESGKKLEPEHVGWIFTRLLQIIGFAHEHKTIHCGVLPQHILVDFKTHSLVLADWTHSNRKGSVVSFIPSRHRGWYGTKGTPLATSGLDVAMAARCVLALGAGKEFAATDRMAAPNFSDWPRSFHNFWKRCLNSQEQNLDAWEMHEEFVQLLEHNFGPPTFHELQPVG